MLAFGCLASVWLEKHIRSQSFIFSSSISSYSKKQGSVCLSARGVRWRVEVMGILTPPCSSTSSGCQLLRVNKKADSGQRICQEKNKPNRERQRDIRHKTWGNILPFWLQKHILYITEAFLKQQYRYFGRPLMSRRESYSLKRKAERLQWACPPHFCIAAIDGYKPGCFTL